MPVSDIGSIGPILYCVQRLQPKGILDLGCGFGKYGVLCREILEAVHGRCRPDQWENTICGVDGFKDYANPCWGVYNNVAIEDFSRHYEKIVGWPLILLVDSLEHVNKELGITILDWVVKNNQNVIVSVPLGFCPQSAVFGNSFETHRATWVMADFDRYRHEVLHVGVCGVVLIKREDDTKP